MGRKSKTTLLTVALVVVSGTVVAQMANVPNQFTANTPIVASEVNANFDAVMAEVNTLRANHGAAVNNANGNPNVSDTVLDVEANLQENVWTAVCATGGTRLGGVAFVTWTALDAVPAGADWVTLRIKLVGNGNGTGGASNRSASVWARNNGSAEAESDANLIASASASVDSAGIGHTGSVSLHPVPFTSGCFELQWWNAWPGVTVTDVYLVGWGSNL